MKRLTVLSAISILHLILTTIWSLFYFSEVNDGEGLGTLFMLGLYSIGVAGLVISWLTGLLCKKYILNQPRRIQNTIEVAILAGFLVFMALTY